MKKDQVKSEVEVLHLFKSFTHRQTETDRDRDRERESGPSESLPSIHASQQRAPLLGFHGNHRLALYYWNSLGKQADSQPHPTPALPHTIPTPPGPPQPFPTPFHPCNP